MFCRLFAFQLLGGGYLREPISGLCYRRARHDALENNANSVVLQGERRETNSLFYVRRLVSRAVLFELLLEVSIPDAKAVS